MIRHRKFVLFLLAGLLLIPILAACQSQQTADPTLSHEPLSEEKIKEIKSAWMTNPFDNWTEDQFYRWDLTSGDCYYGTVGDCIIIFDTLKDSVIQITGNIQIAGISLTSPLPAVIFVFRHGEFAYITTAYENGWLTKEQIMSIAEYHSTIPGRSWEEILWLNTNND